MVSTQREVLSPDVMDTVNRVFRALVESRMLGQMTFNDLQKHQRMMLLLSGLLHFVPHGRCGVAKDPLEIDGHRRSKYSLLLVRQSIFCVWSPTLKPRDNNERHFGVCEGAAKSNCTLLQEGIQFLLQRNDLSGAEMMVDQLLFGPLYVDDLL